MTEFILALEGHEDANSTEENDAPERKEIEQLMALYPDQ